MAKKATLPSASDFPKSTPAWEALESHHLLPELPAELFRLVWGEEGLITGADSWAPLYKATELFLKQISYADFCFFKEHGYIQIVADKSEYRLYPRRAGNLTVLKEKYKVATYDSCFEDQSIPVIDQLVSQYILLKNDADRYIKTQCVLIKRG